MGRVQYSIKMRRVTRLNSGIDEKLNRKGTSPEKITG